MIHAKMFRNIEASLLALCNKTIQQCGLASFEPFNFDTHAIINTTPMKDLLGIAELSIDNMQGTYEVSCMIVVQTTANDSEVKKCRNAIDQVFDILKPGTHIEVVTSDEGTYIGTMVVKDGVRALPMGADKGRPLQCIAVNLGTNLIVEP